MKKIDEIRAQMKMRPYPPGWYGPDGELTDDSLELIAFNTLLSDHNYEVTPEVLAECQRRGIDHAKYIVRKCSREDMGDA